MDDKLLMTTIGHDLLLPANEGFPPVRSEAAYGREYAFNMLPHSCLWRKLLAC